MFIFKAGVHPRGSSANLIVELLDRFFDDLSKGNLRDLVR